MAAFLVALLASFAVTIGSRWWRLAGDIVTRQPDAHGWGRVALVTLIPVAVSAIGGGWIATIVRGPGMLLLLALSLLFAVPALLWQGRATKEAVDADDTAFLPSIILMLSALLTDSAPFVIFAVAAWTGHPILAGIGGLAGLLASAAFAASLDLSQGLPPWLRIARIALAVILFILALFMAMRAMGIG